MLIIQDTREQIPLKFHVEGAVEGVVVEACPVGDYWCQFKDGTRPPVFFERKSLPDLFSTFTAGHDRFKREILLAEHRRWKIVLIIEATMQAVEDGYHRSQLSGASAVQKAFTLWARYGLLPVFCPDARAAAAFIVQTYAAIGRCWKADKQPLEKLFGGLQLPLSGVTDYSVEESYGSEFD